MFKREPETRLFDINYLATERAGSTQRRQPTARRDGSPRASRRTTKTDVFADIAKGVQTLLSEQGTFNVDRKAGLLQVTDFPERLDRVGVYLDAVQDRVHRQVQIDARVLEVELNDEKAVALDWTRARAQARDAGRRCMAGADAAQGTVTMLANPRLSMLNNEPAHREDRRDHAQRDAADRGRRRSSR